MIDVSKIRKGEEDKFRESYREMLKMGDAVYIL
jgi:hypothetical protein